MHVVPLAVQVVHSVPLITVVLLECVNNSWYLTRPDFPFWMKLRVGMTIDVDEDTVDAVVVVDKPELI